MRSAFAVACLPVALAIVVARTHYLAPTGDEPHYLIMADSIASDFDLDLHNNYLADFDSHRIIGLIVPHVYNAPRGWMPGHEAGLSFLVALPFRVGGIAAVRVALCLFALVLPWSLCAWFGTLMPAATAAWLTLGLTISLPILFGAQQIYNDLLGGIAATGLLLHALVALDGEPRRRWTWGLFFLVAGLLPWLHAKFAATAIVLAAAGAVGLWRSGRRQDRPTALLFLVGPALLVAFNLWAAGSPLGFRRASELTSSFGRGAEMFLGLHFDQSQGMFVQQPLLLAGIAALPCFFARRRGIAVVWLIVYLSLIVPNALELTRYGGGGPAGRFAWSAAWLWAIPIGYAIGANHARVAPWVRRGAIAAWVYQVALAARWLGNPDGMFPVLDQQIAARDSLFPVAMRGWLPSFYFWDFSSYWTYPPNLAAFALVAALAVAGARASAARHVG